MVTSGHILSPDPKVAHDRLQATIHLTSAMVAHKIKSPVQSLVMSRINEHHHQYGTEMLNFPSYLSLDCEIDDI